MEAAKPFFMRYVCELITDVEFRKETNINLVEKAKIFAFHLVN